MSNFFTTTSSNQGMLVGPEFYMQDSSSKRDVGMGVINNITQDLGLNIGDIVDMMVMSHMGVQIEEKQAEITNKNVEMGALNIFASTMNSFGSNTISPLNNSNALTSYELNNSNSSAVGARIGSSGLDRNIDFNLRIDQLAQSHSLTFGGYDSPDQALPAGTMTINFGEYTGGGFNPNSSSGQISVNVEDGMTLQELADEISEQSPDVTAEVVPDPDGGYKIAIVSNNTGKEQAMQITTSGGLGDLEYNGQDTATATEVQKAQDAEYAINGIPMTNATNNVSYGGVDLTLTKASDETIKISSESAPDGVVTNVDALVQNYNSMAEMFNMFNESSPYYDYVGSLYGTDISKVIAEEMSGMWSGIQSAGLSMSDLGITEMADGSLRFDEATLRKNLDVNPNLAKEILASTAEVSVDWMTIVSNGESVDGIHDIVIDDAPEKATLTSGSLNNPTIVTEDTVIEFKVNGRTVELELVEGEYTPSQISSRVSSAIAGAGVSGYTVRANVDDELVFESGEYGSSQSIEFEDDVPLLGIVAGRETGNDVKGYINGQRVLGTGTQLTSSFDPATEGLVITVDPDRLVLGQQVDLTTKTGALDRMSASIDALVDPLDGSITREVLEIQAMLSESGKVSLVNELQELYDQQEMWYEYYVSIYSTLAAELQAMDNTANYLATMFDYKKD